MFFNFSRSKTLGVQAGGWGVIVVTVKPVRIRNLSLSLEAALDTRVPHLFAIISTLVIPEYFFESSVKFSRTYFEGAVPRSTIFVLAK